MVLPREMSASFKLSSPLSNFEPHNECFLSVP